MSVDLSAGGTHLDSALDTLCGAIQEINKREERKRAGRTEIFREIWDLAEGGTFPDVPMASRGTSPYLTEPWYC